MENPNHYAQLGTIVVTFQPFVAMKGSVRQPPCCHKDYAQADRKSYPQASISFSKDCSRIDVDNFVVDANTPPMATLPEIAKLLAEAIRARGVMLPQRFSVELGAGETIDILVEDSSCKAARESVGPPESSGELPASSSRPSGQVSPRSSMLVRIAKSCRPDPVSEPSSRVRQHETLSSMPPEEELA